MTISQVRCEKYSQMSDFTVVLEVVSRNLDELHINLDERDSATF